MTLPHSYSIGQSATPRLARHRFHFVVVIAIMSWHAAADRASAQPPPPAPPEPPPPIWDLQLGASFVGTSGNSDTSSFGAKLEAHRRWPAWRLEALASSVRTTDKSEDTAEQYIAELRVKLDITDRIAATSGVKFERDRLGGLDLRSLLDAGLSYVLVRQPKWTLDGLTTLAWGHEERVTGETRDEFQAALGAVNKYRFGASGETMQRFTFYPNFTNSTGYRSEAEVTAQAAMNSRLAMKFGFL